MPGVKYMGDITYLPVGDGRFLYLVGVLDYFSRRVVGYSIADHMRTELVADALRMARDVRDSLHSAVFHSEPGQYTSKEFAVLCKKLNVAQSMGAVGTSADNAAFESFHASLKRETLQGAHCYDGARSCRLTVFRWLTRPLQHPPPTLRKRATQPPQPTNNDTSRSQLHSPIAV